MAENRPDVIVVDKEQKKWTLIDFSVHFSKIFLSTIGAETLRICRASSCFEHFIRFCQPFFSRMINQGANVCEIKSVFVKFFKRHETIFSKFNKTSEQIIVELKF